MSTIESSLLELPKRLAPSISEAAGVMESSRALPEKLVHELREHGAFRLITPRELGGFEAPLETVLKVYEAFGRLDASVAWTVWNANWGFIGSMLDQAGRERIWGDGREPIFANSGQPGIAVPTDGGYRVSGTWKIVTGIGQADWLAVVCAVVENGSQRMTAQGAPDFRLFVLGRSQWETKDTWDVSGLIGSGSHGVAAQNAFVPDELVAGIEGPVHINRPLYQGYMPALVLPGCSAVVLGVAQAAIEETVALAPSKRTLLGGILAESAHAQEVIAQSEAALQAARLLLYSAAAALDTACERSEPVTMQQRASLRAAMSHGAQVSRKVLMDMYELGGSSALYRGNSVERLFRDGMVALQHGNHNTSLFEAVGRVRLGMAPGRMLF